MKKLTPEEHETYVHLCGKTGAEVEGSDICKDCERLSECLDDHSIPEWQCPRPGG